jgi:hypothetical protein
MNRYVALKKELMPKPTYHCGLCGRFGYNPLCVEMWSSSGGYMEPVEYDCDYVPACKRCYDKHEGGR